MHGGVSKQNFRKVPLLVLKIIEDRADLMRNKKSSMW